MFKLSLNVRTVWDAEVIWRCGRCLRIDLIIYNIGEKGGQEQFANMNLHVVTRYLSQLKCPSFLINVGQSLKYFDSKSYHFSSSGKIYIYVCVCGFY